MGNGRTIGIAVGLTLVFALGIGLLAAEIYYATRKRVWKRSPTQQHHHHQNNNNSTMLAPTMSPMSTTPPRNGNGNVKTEEDPRFLAKLFPLSSYDAYVAGGHSPLFTIKEENSSAIGDEESVGPSPPPKWPYAYSIGLLGPPPKAKAIANANANAKGKKRIMLLEAASPSPQPITSLDMACHVANVASASIPRTSSSSSEKSTRWCRSDYSESTPSPSPPQSTWSGSERKSYSVSSAYGTPLSSPSQLARLSLSPCSSLGRSDRYVRHRNDDDQEI